MNTRYIQTIVSLALSEDIGSGDVTTDPLVSKKARCAARIIAGSEGVVCGLPLAKEVFRRLDRHCQFRPLVKDGQAVKKAQVLALVKGSARAILSGERTALNFLGQLSGVATQTRAFVKAVKPYKTAILDTRKTTPLLRQLQRYAVSCGGGANHRFNLADMAMVKDNHLALAGGRAAIKTLIKAVREANPVKVELEVDSLAQLKEGLNSGADVILLDNMSAAQVRAAVKLRRSGGSKIPLEVSGGITLKNVRLYASTGVERISVGALTHSVKAMDVSLELD